MRPSPRARAARMRATEANDSLECRNCHDYDYMDFTRQSPRAQYMHARFVETREKTCIDCHKGIAHLLPNPEGVQLELFDQGRRTLGARRPSGRLSRLARPRRGKETASRPITSTVNGIPRSATRVPQGRRGARPSLG
jgi:hypothetical protein